MNDNNSGHAHSDDENIIIEENDNVVEMIPEKESPTLEQQLSDMKDQWLRSVAECDNIRKRAQREKEEAMKYGAVSLARDLIPVIDNLRRAMDACALEDKSSLSTLGQNLVTGIDMIISEIDSALTKHHIKRLNPLHEEFNAHFHQAMMELENSEHQPGTVLQVLQDGYILHDRLLRPAMVAVSKAPASA